MCTWKSLSLIFLLSTSLLFGKVYDCFMFFNEWELLEIRLNELNDYVDKFVLVEANETHRTAQPKPFYFEQEKQRFEKFLGKIIHVKLDEHIESNDGWVRENWHRNQIMRGLKECDPEDLILISDVDEMIPGALIPRLYEATGRHHMIGFFQQIYRWYLNRTLGEGWSGTAALRYKHLVKSSPQEVRNLSRFEGDVVRWCAGWHFTAMGGYERNCAKFFGMVEGYDEPLSFEKWNETVGLFSLVPIDIHFPRYVNENIDYLTEIGLIAPNN